MSWIVIERRAPDRTQQHGRRSQASLYRVRGQWIVRGRESRSANGFRLELKLVAEALGHGLQNENGLFRNFRSNAVARESRNFQEHGRILAIRTLMNWVIANLTILSCVKKFLPAEAGELSFAQ
jgi:hypothetical protein